MRVRSRSFFLVRKPMTEDLMEWDGAPVSAELELIWLEVVDLEYVEGVPIGLF
jgi:hypothetical protein